MCRRIDILQFASVNDNSLLSLIDDDDIDIEDLLNDQRQNLRYQCIYLRKAYETAMQFMNSLSWTKCIDIALLELSDQGIFHFKNEKAIRILNKKFRHNESFAILNQRQSKLPAIFAFLSLKQGLCLLHLVTIKLKQANYQQKQHMPN